LTVETATVIPHSRPWLGDEDREAVLAAIDRSWVGAGGETSAAFAHQLAGYLGRSAAVPVSSGTTALEIALRVIGATGRDVAVPAYACASLVRAVVRAGAKPLLVDVDPADLSIPAAAVESLARRTAAILLVHQFGLPAACSVEASEAPVPVVEDVTAGLGARLAGRLTGSFGRLVIVSLAATKLLCAGEGGAIAGGEGDLEDARLWVDPESSLPDEDPVGNAKLSALACALGQAQLAKLPQFLDRRREIARYYDQRLGHRAEQVLRPRAGDQGAWWRYLISVEDPDSAVERARARGVTFARPVLERRWARYGRFPVADRLRESLVSAPVYPALSDEEVERVADALGDAV
jgi:perosamine synthetase